MISRERETVGKRVRAGIPPSAGNDYRYPLATGHYCIVSCGSAERITMIVIKKNEPVRSPNTIERCINNVITNNNNNNSRRQSPNDLDGDGGLPAQIILLLYTYSERRDPFIPDSVSARVEH